MSTRAGRFARQVGGYRSFLPSRHPPSSPPASGTPSSIHPFLGGNGRVGRLLITLVLVERQVLRRPLLYLSLFLKRNRTEYYDRLSAVRENGDWEGWLRFFLTGMTVTADDAAHVAAAVGDLRDRHLRLTASENLGRYAVPMLDLLTAQPLLTVGFAVGRIGGTPTTVGRLLDRLAALGVVEEVTGRRRFRVYRYSPFLDLCTFDLSDALAP